MIANCRSSMGNDINGDASGQEYRLQSWFAYNWDCVLRYPDTKVSKLISNFARHAAQNDHIGYSLNQRIGMANELINGNPASKGTYDPKDITIDCAADCSSSTAAIVKAVGYRLGLAALKNVDQNATTWTLESALTRAGFQVYKSADYLNGESKLQPGDIILNTNSHVCIYVADSDYTDSVATVQSSTAQTSVQTSVVSVKTPIKANTKGAGVAAIQGILIYLGKDVGRYRDKRGVASGIDGDVGSAYSTTNTRAKEAISSGLITQEQIDQVLKIFQ